MNKNIEEINDTRKKITISFDAQEVAQENDKITKDFVRNASMPGFRKGKAPVAMIVKKYADAIKEQFERSLTSKAIDELNKVSEFDIYSVVDMQQADNEGSFELTFTADVYPVVTLPETLETKVELEPTEVTEEEIDKAIEFYRNQRAKYEEADRAVKEGDFVRLSYTGTVDGTPIKEVAGDLPLYQDQKSTWEEAGNKEAPGVQGIVQGIVGMTKGEKKTVTHEFPNDIPNEAVAGKTASYEVEVLDIREKIVPEVDAEFLKAFEAESVEQFREKIKSNIENEKKSNNEVVKRQLAVEQLMEKVDFPIPESALEDERHSILEEMMTSFMSQGASKEDIEKNKESLFENAGQEAGERAKMRIFLNRVAKAQELIIDNEDMSRMIWQEAMRTRTKPEELIKQIQKDRARVNRMRSDALLQKAINFIAEKTEVAIKSADSE